jgi:hypothetical protein
MSERSIGDALFGTLEQHRDDPFTLTALADWFEESDDVAAADCLRWVLRNRRRPGYNPSQVHYGRFYWELEAPQPIIGDPPAQLPPLLWSELTDYDEGRPVVSFKSYQCARLAYLALIAAWKRGGQRVADLPLPSS